MESGSEWKRFIGMAMFAFSQQAISMASNTMALFEMMKRLLGYLLFYQEMRW